MRALKHFEKKDFYKDDTVTTQAHEGIETIEALDGAGTTAVTTQAHEGIETWLSG